MLIRPLAVDVSIDNEIWSSGSICKLHFNSEWDAGSDFFFFPNLSPLSHSGLYVVSDSSLQN